MKKIVRSLFEKIQTIKDVHRELKEKKKKQEASITPPPKNPTQKIDTTLQKIELEISPLTVMKVLFVISLFFIASKLIIQLQSILTIALICSFLAIGLTPIVQSIEKRKVPRPIAILLLYLLFFGGLGILFFSIIPVLSEQLNPILKDISKLFGINLALGNTTQMFNDIGELNIETLLDGGYSNIIETLQEHFQNMMGATFGILSDVFEGVFNMIFGLVLLFFMILERETLSKSILSFFSHEKQDYIIQKTSRVQDKMARWFKGQFILMISVGLAMYIGMKVFEVTLGMKYAATIGILSAFMELFPYIGVFITGIFTLLIAYNISWTLVIVVLIWIAFIQFLEGNVLVPIVMEKVTGLSSVIVMIALAIGGTLGYAAGGIALSILGMIFSIPVTASIAIFIEEYIHKKQNL